MNQAIKEINKLSLDQISSNDLTEFALYLASVDPSFSEGLKLVLNGKSADDALELTMTPEDAKMALSTNCGEISESSIIEKIEDSQLRRLGDELINDVINKFEEKDDSISLESIVLPDSKPNLKSCNETGV